MEDITTITLNFKSIKAQSETKYEISLGEGLRVPWIETRLTTSVGKRISDNFIIITQPTTKAATDSFINGCLKGKTCNGIIEKFQDFIELVKLCEYLGWPISEEGIPHGLKFENIASKDVWVTITTMHDVEYEKEQNPDTKKLRDAIKQAINKRAKTLVGVQIGPYSRFFDFINSAKHLGFTEFGSYFEDNKPLISNEVVVVDNFRYSVCAKVELDEDTPENRMQATFFEQFLLVFFRITKLETKMRSKGQVFVDEITDLTQLWDILGTQNKDCDECLMNEWTNFGDNFQMTIVQFYASYTFGRNSTSLDELIESCEAFRDVWPNFAAKVWSQYHNDMKEKEAFLVGLNIADSKRKLFRESDTIDDVISKLQVRAKKPISKQQQKLLLERKQKEAKMKTGIAKAQVTVKELRNQKQPNQKQQTQKRK